jgi:lipid II:glycine glycyltransferase (peptidoglycan interpeptide bridge formation enzyme)
VDPKDPEYHLYEYKHEFGAEFIEHIGEFDYVRNEGRMKRFRFEKLAFNHVKRKVWAVRYK